MVDEFHVVVYDQRMAVATTGADPTVGLVFYDLKTLLRQLAQDDGGDDIGESGSGGDDGAA